MKLTGDNLEYAISQYLDGTLSDLDRRVLEEQVATDAEARLVLEQYCHLNEVIARGSEINLPVNFEKFSAHLAQQIENEETLVAKPVRMQMVWVRRLSIAAGLALMVAVGYQFIPSSKMPSGNIQSPDNGSIVVTGPSVESASNLGSINIAVGPTEQLKQNGQTMSIVDEAFVTPAPKVVISGEKRSGGGSTDERLY